MSIAYSHLALLPGQQEAYEKLMAESSWHLSVALPYYSWAIGNITQDNCSVLFAFATLMVLHTYVNASEDFDVLLSAEMDADGQLQRQQSLSHIITRVIRSIRGIFFVFFRFQKWITTGTLLSMVQRHTSPILAGPQISWETCEDERLSEIELLWQKDSAVNQRSSWALSEALFHLRGAFKLVTQLTVLSNPESAAAEADLGEIHRHLLFGRLDDMPSAFTWLVSISPKYLSLLEQLDPFAVAVLAHYAILLDRACSRTWWMRNLPSQLVATALLVLGEERRSWIEWPIKVVGIEVLKG